MPDLTPQQKKDLFCLVLLVSIVGIVLIVTVLLFFRAWRRSVLRAQRKGNQEMMPDIWKAGGQRLSQQMTPLAEDEVEKLDGEDDDDDDDFDPLDNLPPRDGPEKD